MKEYYRIFLSYAQNDVSDAEMISSHLKQQGVEVWEYARQWKKGDLGYPLPDDFVELMQRATWFVPMVSAASVNPSSGKYTVRELEYALEMDMILLERVVPVVLAGSRPKKWLKPFDALESLDAVTIDFHDTRLFLQGIAELCHRLKRTYKPIINERPLLPFWRGFIKEIERVGKEMDNAWRLMPVITELDQCWQKEDWREALILIEYFIDTVRYCRIIPDLACSWLVKAVCELACGLPAAAEESIRNAVRVMPDTPAVYGVTGYLHLHRKEYAEARECFKTALIGCEEDGLLCRFYFLRPLIEHGEALSTEQRRLVLESDPSHWSESELTGLLNAGEILHYQSGEYEKAVELFEAARRRGIHDTTSVLYAQMSYLKLDESAAAEKILVSAIRESAINSRINAPVLHYHHAELALAAGDLAKTLQIYEKHLLRPQTIIRRFAVRHAQILRRLGDKKRMRMVCLRMLGGQFPAPKTCEDFYYDGFAQHLLGNSERAQYDFERSKQFAPFYSRCE